MWFQAHLYDGYKYRGNRNLEELTEFVLSNLKVNIEEISSANWDKLRKNKWLLFLCADSDICLEKSSIKKLAATLVYCYFICCEFI